MKKEVIIRLKKINIYVDKMLFIMVGIVAILGYIDEFWCIFISIVLHELGHIVLSLFMGGRVWAVRVLPIGMNAVVDVDMCSRRERIAIYLSGPFTNILLAILFFVIDKQGQVHSTYVEFFISINIYLAIFNILPILPLDGGNILREYLVEKYGIFMATKSIKRFSLLLCIIVMLMGTVQLLQNIRNFSLIMIGVYIFFSTSFKETEASLMNIKSVIYRRSRILKKGIYGVRDLVVMKNMYLSEVVKHMDFDKFHIIHVLDEDLKIVKTFTEQEVMDGMLKYSTELTFGEFIENRR